MRIVDEIYKSVYDAVIEEIELPDGWLMSKKEDCTDARSILIHLLAGMEGEDAKKCQWDAYVGANGFAHDLANSGLSKSDILKAAKQFWFHDDDFAGDKVYWYYSDMLFKN